MTPEERITQLEQEVARLVRHSAETRDLCLVMAGAARAFEIAVLALLSSTKHPEAVEKEITERLKGLDSELVFESMSEEQLDGAQRASEALMGALQVAHASAMPSFPAVEQSAAVEPESVAASCESVGLLH